MSARPPAVASLFGRFTATLAEHENLHETLARVDELCGAIEAEQPELVSRLQPSRLLADLTSVLATHFAVEEAGIYFGSIVRERPHFAGKVAELRAEHDVMLSIVTQLREMASTRNGWPRIAAPGRVLLEMLAAHERAESRLLQTFMLSEAS